MCRLEHQHTPALRRWPAVHLPPLLDGAAWRAMSYSIRTAVFPEERAAVRTLFERYQAELGIDLCFQNFAAELRDLPGSYVAPGGFLLVARSSAQLVGCVALKPLDAAAAEMKRLYV